MSNSLNLCNICNSPAKYKCPKCTTTTCSLECVKEHYTKFNCQYDSNTKLTVKYVNKTEFDVNTLKQDCKILDTIAESMENTTRAFVKPIIDNIATSHNKVKLRVLLIMKRARVNMTLIRKKYIYWTIEWVFYTANVTYYDKRVCEELIIEKALNRTLDKVKMNRENRNLLSSYLKFKGDCVILMRNISTPSNVLEYYKFDNKLSIRENLKYTKILDFPQLIVVLSHELEPFNMLVHSVTQEPTFPQYREGASIVLIGSVVFR